MTDGVQKIDVERNGAAQERAPDSRGWLHRVFVGKPIAPWRATFGLIFGPLLLTADAILQQVRGEAALRPWAAPLVLGITLVATSHLMAAEHARPRLAAQLIGNALITAAVVLWIVDWPW